MCKWRKNGFARIDLCMKDKIKRLNNIGIKTLACCCGHNIYPETIIVKDLTSGIIELNTHTPIPRKAHFYKRDLNNVYFIPEISKGQT